MRTPGWGSPRGAVAGAIATRACQQDRITHVAAVESRGFLLGGAAALALGVGFAAIRKATGWHLPAPVLTQETGHDYKGERGRLRLQSNVLPAGARVLVIDDWFQTGSQFRATRSRLQRASAILVGASVIVDQTQPELCPALGKFHALIRAEELTR